MACFVGEVSNCTLQETDLLDTYPPDRLPCAQAVAAANLRFAHPSHALLRGPLPFTRPRAATGLPAALPVTQRVKMQDGANQPMPTITAPGNGGAGWGKCGSGGRCLPRCAVAARGQVGRLSPRGIPGRIPHR